MLLRAITCAVWQPAAKLILRTGFSSLQTRLTPVLATACLQGADASIAPTHRLFQTTPVAREMSEFEYDKVCKVSLENLCEYFEKLLEEVTDADVNLSDGVLTVMLGQNHGTYVINKQTPNRQIWLSSPISGPKSIAFIYTSGATGLEVTSTNSRNGYVFNQNGFL
ncbi:frataxin homolog, mitochondrial-like isoform X3 [Varroa jacobsoni]|uniref:frataxin homolog, mitochondrial-like isoform X3 n=1 Tax=Varroa jacobsoni TaxID=62625 RepID=UPI000BF94D27|nr:frataxin homolog, mitochondrial-like isoform X3 [Varroa jacobsoni]